MNDLIKNVDTKLVSILFLIVGFFLISESNAHARFMKKIMIEPLLNPKDWKGSFEPGIAFALMLEKSLADSGQFQIVQPTKESTKKLVSSIFKNLGVVEEEKPETEGEEGEEGEGTEGTETKEGEKDKSEENKEETKETETKKEEEPKK